MVDENAAPQSDAPALSFDKAKAWLEEHSALPPAPELKTLEPAHLAKLVACDSFAPFLPQLWPAAFGARRQPERARARGAKRRGASPRNMARPLRPSPASLAPRACLTPLPPVYAGLQTSAMPPPSRRGLRRGRSRWRGCSTAGI